MSREKLLTLLYRVGPWGLLALGLILLAGGILAGKLRPKNEESEIIIEEGQVSGVSKASFLTVDVGGAVERPGVYQLPNDSRIQDALITAGGIGAKADRNYVAKYINLAQKVSDGGKIYIPFAGELALTNAPNEDRLISLNSATLAELDSLPGIGAVTAQKIIANRPYQNISQLLENKIVNKTVFENIKDRLSVY